MWLTVIDSRAEVAPPFGLDQRHVGVDVGSAIPTAGDSILDIRHMLHPILDCLPRKKIYLRWLERLVGSQHQTERKFRLFKQGGRCWDGMQSAAEQLWVAFQIRGGRIHSSLCNLIKDRDLTERLGLTKAK